MKSNNPKTDAWNHIGGLFWSQGRTSARPSSVELDLFCADVASGERVCLVGASTLELAEELLRLGARLTVLDFSERMVDDLTAAVDGADIRVCDITAPVPEDLLGVHSWVLADRLINRFDASEAVKGVQGMASLLAAGGVLRNSVKLGLYPMDETMLNHAQAAGTAETFWNAETRTIDFSLAGESLETGILPHGTIDIELLKQWYLGRGREKRFDEAEILDLLTSAGLTEPEVAEFPDAPGTAMFSARRS